MVAVVLLMIVGIYAAVGSMIYFPDISAALFACVTLATITAALLLLMGKSDAGRGK